LTSNNNYNFLEIIKYLLSRGSKAENLIPRKKRLRKTDFHINNIYLRVHGFKCSRFCNLNNTIPGIKMKKGKLKLK